MTYRMSLGAYISVEMGLTASGSVVLMSCTMVDGEFDIISHRTEFADAPLSDPDL